MGCKAEDQLLIPAFSQDTHCSAVGVAVYMVALLWCFLGVALIADIFMAAIETITAKETSVRQEVLKEVGSAEKVEKEFTVKVWNETVANLTLMALGSSAPEILLSVIEILSNDFYSGDLGPSTIVGSAAFNLFIIISVCVVAIGPDDARKIIDLKVFAVTAVFSVLAYLWLVVILVFITPDIVDIWEAVVTFLLFPVLVTLAYMADAKMWCFQDGRREMGGKLLSITGADGSPLSEATLKELSMAVVEKYGENLTPEQNAQLIVREAAKQRKRSRSYYRIQATRKMTGGKKVQADIPAEPDLTVKESMVELKVVRPTISFNDSGILVNESAEADKTSVEFQLTRKKPNGEAHTEGPASVDLYAQAYTPPEQGTTWFKGSGAVGVTVEQNELPAKQDNATPDGDFITKCQFKDGECTINVAFDLTPELASKRQFKLALDNASTPFQLHEEGSECLCNIAHDEGYAGMLAFEDDRPRCDEDCGTIELVVQRQYGNHGRITCKWKTRDGTALASSDYVEAEGTLVFEDGETAKTISIEIIDDTDYELEEHFYVELYDAEDGVMFDPTTDGHADKCIARVSITDNDELKTWVDNLVPFLEFDKDALALGNAEWGAQFRDALKVNGDAEDPDEEASCMDWVLHILSVPWKLLFATVPPCRCCGGWLTFVIALIFIGALTAVIGDLATLMGNAMSLKDTVTAITFVALGTSLPDTFASKKAAEDEPSADAAVGNVTGSNAVNVFLGLGFPWLIAACYWESASDSDKADWSSKYCGANPSKVDSALDACSDGVGFAVPAGDLGISVGVFSGCAVVCLLSLVARRRVYGCELGGGGRWPTAFLFCSLWAAYIGVSCYLAYR